MSGWGRGLLWCVAILIVAVCLVRPAWGLPEKGQPIPDIRATDIRGQLVDIDEMLKANPELIIAFLFRTNAGEDIARRLRLLDKLYGRERLRIVAFGVQQDAEALKQFAADFGIEYAIIPDTPDTPIASIFGAVDTLPVTIIIAPEKQVWKVLIGGGEAAQAILARVAEAYLVQGKTQDAKALADQAKEAGENARVAAEVKAYALTAEGQLDAADAEFGAIGSKAGQARIALERGELDRAVALANEAPNDGYAQTVKAKALAETGNLDAAKAAFEQAAQQTAAFDWQKSEAVSGAGRIKHELGDTASALQDYQQAVNLEPYNVAARSNAAAVYRAQGNAEKALAALEEAAKLKNDQMVSIMLGQIRDELAKASDVKRAELIQAQIADLRARFQEAQASGAAQRADQWTSRPLVLAFLPSAEPGAFFERAGMDTVLRREIETQLQVAGGVRVVDREMLDKLLQELQLGSSQLADPQTQLHLGRVLSANLIGFVDFARIGPDTLMNVRLVDTETTEIVARISRNLRNEKDLVALAGGIADEIRVKVADQRQLQGLIAEASSPDAVVINLGDVHGVLPGQRFMVLEEGEPIEVGGRVISYKQRKLGVLEVIEVQHEYALTKTVEDGKGVPFAKGMKVKAQP